MSNIELTQTEREARRLMEEAREEQWSPIRTIICNVFIAMWSRALTVNSIRQIGLAMGGLAEIDEKALKKELSRLVRNGYLRSRNDSSGRLYEINY